MNYDIIPLFSKVFYIKKLDIDTKKIVSMMNNDFEKAGSKTSVDIENICSSSISMSVLEQNKFSSLKKQIMKIIFLYHFLHHLHPLIQTIILVIATPLLT